MHICIFALHKTADFSINLHKKDEKALRECNRLPKNAEKH